MNELSGLIRRVNNQLYANAFLRCLLSGASVGLLVLAVLKFSGVVKELAFFSGFVALFGFSTAAYFNGMFKRKKPLAVKLIHQTLDNTEYSLHLLEKEELNVAEQLQIDRLLFKINNSNPDHAIPFREIYAGLGAYILVFLLSAGVYFINPLMRAMSVFEKPAFQSPTLKRKNSLRVPVFENAMVRITPPLYTGLSAKQSKELNVSAISGSVLSWEVHFDSGKDLSVRLANSRNEEISFKKERESFFLRDKLTSSGLYSIRAYWADSLVYQSDFYKLEAVADKPPVIEPSSKEFYQNHYHKDKKTLLVQAHMSDDFSVDQAYIVATVARGSGENVKFREIRFPLTPSHFKNAKLEKIIDLKALHFTPGDELYYYWAATDNKRPEPNFAKSDTYFVVYKDSTETEASELATMAVDIMPEYFRSQRQIIIDTKKLIAKRKMLPKTAFNSTSNEIGFDQKVLRLRYGQYLGEEFESNMGGAAIPDDDAGNVLASFEHKSDASEEDHFRQQKKRKEETHEHDDHGSAEEKDPMVAILEQFSHSHDDEETATFYEESTKNMLKMALEQMWQSELHLRMYEPEKAIPYETKALEYLKGAQQKVRAFVKKSGFDPPPIKEKEKRLTGELTDIVKDRDDERMYDQKRISQLVAEVLGYLEYNKLTAANTVKIQNTGAQLSDIILKTRSGSFKDWPVLSLMQKMMSGKMLTKMEKEKLKNALFVLTDRNMQKSENYLSDSALEKAFWKQLNQ